MMTMTTLGRLLIVTLVALSAIPLGFATGRAQDVPETIKIGVTSPLSGSAAQSGVGLQQGMQIAETEWNDKGGVKLGDTSIPVEFLFEDSQQKPEVGVSAAQKLVTSDGVHLLIGDAFASSVTMAIMEMAPVFNIPILSAEPVSEEISKKVRDDPEKYALYWKGDFSSGAYATAVHDTFTSLFDAGQVDPGTKKIAFVVEDTDYGRSNSQLTSDLFAKDGWETVANETVPLGHSDFYPQLTKINDLQPDAVVTVFTAVNSGVAFVKQYSEVGLTAAHMAIFYPTRPEFREQAAAAAEHLIWTPLLFDPASNPEQKAFDDKVRAAFSVGATSDHAYGYDTANTALMAIEAAGGVEPEAVSEAIGATDRQGLLGRYVFDAADHTVKAGPEFIPVPSAQIINGQNVIIWPENVAVGQYQPQPWTQR